MPTTVATSTSSTATAYSNQRKIDRCSNGVLWTLFFDATGRYPGNFRYSLDNGSTWNSGGSLENGSAMNGSTYVPNASFFIDPDDYAHVVFKDTYDGFIYYRRGTPNAGRTAWTWSAAVSLSGTAWDYPDVVAHREGTGWVVHAVASSSAGGTNKAWHYRSAITSSGTIDAFTQTELGAYPHSPHTYPSIDFHHTGDGKTVAGGTPHLYVAWSAGATGAGKGIRFRKATYSGGTWTWGTEREIDSTRYITDTSYWLNCLFDGTRVIIGGYIYGTSSDLVLHERDAADTTTTTRTLVAAITSATVPSTGSCSYDGSGNVYFVGLAFTTPRSIGYRKWTRATNTVSAFTITDADAPGSGVSGYVSVKRGYSNNRIEFIYTDGTASPFNINFDLIDLNQAPSVTLAAPGTVDPRASKTISWTFSDPDAGHTQTAYELDYRVSGGTWASLSTGTTASSYNVPANFFADETNYEIRVRVKDAALWSAYDTKTFYTDSWTYSAEITSITTSPGYDDIVKADGPVGYWRLGETSGTVAVDSSGNGNNGTYVGAPTLGVTGAIANDSDKAIRIVTNLAGNGTQYVKAANAASISVTATCWVKLFNDANYDVNQGLMERAVADTTNTDWLLFVEAGVWKWRLQDNAATLQTVSSAAATRDQWVHLAGTFDGTTARLYVDGSEVASQAVTKTTAKAAGNLWIGRLASATEYGLNGEIDEAAVYNRALTAAEIKRHYDAGKGVGLLAQGNWDSSSMIQTDDYDIQVKAFDGYAYSAWSPTALAQSTVLKSASDSGSIAVTDSAGIFYALSASDSSSVAISESRTVFNNMPGSDLGVISVTETATIFKTSAANDAVSLAIADASSIETIFYKTTSDTASIAIVDTRSNAAFTTTTDTSSFAIADASAVFKTIDANDTQGLRITESQSMFNDRPGLDQGAVSITETAAIFKTSGASDTQALVINETTNLGIVAYQTGSDTASLAIADTSATYKTIYMSVTDSSGLGISESSAIMYTLPKAGTDTSSISLSESAIRAKIFSPVNATTAAMLRDKPVGVWNMDSRAVSDYSGYNRTFTVPTVPTMSALSNGAPDSRILSNTNIASFESPVFKQGKERQPFSLEASFRSVSNAAAGEQQVLGNSGQMDGLTVNGSVVSFVTKYLTAGEARAEFDLQVERNVRAVGVHTETKNQLFIDGELVAEALLTPAQQADQYVATDGNLYSGASASARKLAVNNVGIYIHALSPDAVKRHYEVASKHAGREFVSAFGGQRIPFAASETETFLTYRVNSAEQWLGGYRSGVVVDDTALVPELLSSGVSVAGTWLNTFPLDTAGNTSIHGVNLMWDGEGAIVKASVNGGSTWETAVRGKNLSIIPSGYNPTGKVLEVKVEFPGGVLDDPAYIENLLINGFKTSTPVVRGRTITLTSEPYVMTDADPAELRDDWGLALNGGTVTIAGGPTIKTVEVWAKGAYTTNLTPSTTYSNGSTAVATAAGEWQMRTFVINAGYAGDITFTGSAQIGQVVLYEDALNALEVKRIYQSYVGIPSERTMTESVLAVTESSQLPTVYSHDWAENAG